MQSKYKLVSKAVIQNKLISKLETVFTIYNQCKQMFSMQTSSFPTILYFPNGHMIFQKYLMSIILENSFFDKF